ncbi:MAG: metallophosphoesterase [Candidatus Aenigmatarchaeota archaeon]
MFVTDEPAIVLGKTLIVADLHIGITRELYEHGVKIPSQTKPIADRINKLKKKTKTSRLVILGDVKHKVPGVSYQEIMEIPEFFSLLKFRDIVIVKGNHDGNIERLVSAKVKKSLAVGDYLLTHGHRNARTNKNIIIGHNHPHIKFRDKLGATYVEPCWVRGKIGEREVIMMPAFNKLCGATIVNEQTLLGPIAKRIKFAKAYLLDGTDLGYLKDLKIRK